MVDKRFAKLLRRVYLKHQLAGRFIPSKCLVVAGAPRSGTTWLAEIANGFPGTCTLFEPLHPTKVPEAGNLNLGWRPHISPGEQNVESRFHNR